VILKIKLYVKIWRASSSIFFKQHFGRRKVAQHGVHADGWIHTAKMALFVALGFFRFGSESRPSSRR
jgi:hypothetical protein